MSDFTMTAGAVSAQRAAIPLATGLVLAARNIRKAFPGVVALDDVSIDVHAGRVHALMGENGAGKSTMMKIIAGVYFPDEGSLHFKGQPVALKSPRDALNRGIAMIHQELNLLPCMTVAENIWIGREPRSLLRLIDHRALNRHTAELFAQLGIEIDPQALLGDLSIANRQMVEIAKAVSFDSASER